MSTVNSILLVTGGAFDVDPSYYGGGNKHATVITKDRRTAFEFAVTKGALDQNKPVLGICGGQQLLHVVLGGKLIQHIPDTIAEPLAHEQPNPRNEPGHLVKVAKGTQLHGIVGADELAVNSAHHQAAADAPKGVVVNATAPDGVIEGIDDVRDLARLHHDPGLRGAPGLIRCRERRGEEGARREIDMTTIFTNMAHKRLRQHVSDFQKNDDELRKAVAVRAYADRAYPFDVL